MSSPLIVQLVEINETGDSYYRMRWPAQTLATQEPTWKVLNVAANANERFELAKEADLLVLYQSADLDLLPIINERKKRGAPTLVEYNDNFYSPQPWSPVAKEWSSPIIWQRYELFMDLAEGVLVTGPGLQQLFSRRIPPEKIFTLENHLLNAPEPLETIFRARDASHNNRESVILGWAGSLGHMADLLAIAPTIEKILNTFPHVRFHVMGNAAIPDLLKFPSTQFRYTPWGTMQQYYTFLKEIDIGVAPLIDTPYNRCRSDIKAIEMAGCGVAPLLTKLLPYERFLEQSGLPYFESLSELETVLSALVRDREQCRNLATKAYNHVVNTRVANLRSERRELYKRFLSSSLSSAPTISPLSAQFSNGAHEHTGTPQTRPLYAEQLGVTKQLMKEKKLPEALHYVTQALRTAPGNDELAFIRCVLLEQLGDHEKDSFRQECEVRFPRDLRFSVALLTNNATAPHWEKLITLLSARTAAEQLFFAPIIEKKFLAAANTLPELIPLAESLFAIYPHFFELRFFIAEKLRSSGDNAQALTHFEFIQQSKKLVTSTTHNFLLQCEPGYLAAWSEALTIRIRGNLS